MFMSCYAGIIFLLMIALIVIPIINEIIKTRKKDLLKLEFKSHGVYGFNENIEVQILDPIEYKEEEFAVLKIDKEYSKLEINMVERKYGREYYLLYNNEFTYYLDDFNYKSKERKSTETYVSDNKHFGK